MTFIGNVKIRSWQFVAILCVLLPVGALGQTINMSKEPRTEHQEAEAAAESASDAQALVLTRQLNVQTIDNAMRQLARSPNLNLGDQLLLPNFSGLEEFRTALRHDNAWQPRYIRLKSNTDAADLLSYLSTTGGELFYQEWSCKTGAHSALAKQYIDLLPQIVTTYPERMLLKSYMDERELLGFDPNRVCDQARLYSMRAEYQRVIAKVLDL